ncbi:DUF2333 family protein [Terasakiella sp. A23]|uniref:DUF2333 family protein n=1 Tax=Terasakiella sp. FCG-A23 TaxID=3080561 RepID=UPI002953766C|nr:DUF2333 family protein [Terasakiella sp. A23]MDV7339751.1 DUF2333 family protein [Terasakiella sp. A23]
MIDRLPLWLRGFFKLPDVSMSGVGGKKSAFALRGLGVIILIALLYYPIGMALVHKVDDNTTLDTEVQAGQSRSVAMAAALIDRETEIHPWVANDPWFLPGAALDNMPNFQQGIIYALSRYTIEMSDQIGRTRGSSEVDKDLDKAAGLLKYAGDVWVFDFSVSLAPTAPSDSQYKAARKSLISYNNRLAKGEAVFDARADNLERTLERIAGDLGSGSAVIDKYIRESSGSIIDFHADDIYYRNKGRLYAYYLILRELKEDFRNVIEDKELTKAWDQMLDSLKIAAEAQPLVVINGDPDSFWRPSHLTSQGFYLLRARTQLKEVANILLK